MLYQRLYSDQLTFFQKIKSFDIWLILSILALGVIGVVAMYSSEGGEFSYHTTSHIIRFLVFFSMMLVFSFVKIRFWHSLGYIFYFIVVLLLIYTDVSYVSVFYGGCTI